ncbi:MAG: glycosyltransferase [Candidatus Omnitrophica bacterium]|nr:glycosyltransferase [Candidatus Omnitrophota bacterium]
MKILFVSYHNPNFISITEYCEKAIRQLGHECIAFDDRSFVLSGRFREKSAFLQAWDSQQLNTRLLKLAVKENPDLCIVAGGYTIDKKTIRCLKNQGIKIVLWTTDAPNIYRKSNNFLILYNLAVDYDYVFCGGTEAIELLSDLNLKNISWLPFACDPELHKPVEITKHELKMYGNDIVFVGSFYENREKILEQIADFDLGIWGPGWEQLKYHSLLKKRIKYAGNIKPELWLKIYAAAKLVIVAHYNDGKNICYQVSPKVYEALACKCAVLVDNQKDVFLNFENNKHLSVYENGDGLRAQIKYLLDNPGKAKSTAEAGYEQVIEKHTYTQRIKQIIRTVNGES